MTASPHAAVVSWPRWLGAACMAFVTPFVTTVLSDGASAAARVLVALVSPVGWLGVALLLNSTRFSVRGDQLVVRHGPVPWRGCAVAVASVSALEIRAQPSRWGPATWELVALRAGGTPVRLLGFPGSGLRYDRLSEAAQAVSSATGLPLR